MLIWPRLCKIFPIISERLEEDKIDYEILVVNDNSQDNTEAVLQKIDQGNPQIHYINSYYPNSFGLAVRCGLENFSGEGVSKLKLKEMGSRYLFIVLSIWLEKHLSRGDYKRKQKKIKLFDNYYLVEYC